MTTSSGNRPLRRYARALTRDETQAEDLVHDALVRAYERRSTFRLGGNLDVALSILHNTFIDGQRKQAAELRRDAEMARPCKIVPPPRRRAASACTDPAGSMPYPRPARRPAPRGHRGAAYQDAAAVLRIPIGTLMSRLGRARTALRAFETRPGDRLRFQRRIPHDHGRTCAWWEARMTDPITEVDLHAFIDDQLLPERRLDVEDHLARHPEVAARVMADLRARDALKLAFGQAPMRKPTRLYRGRPPSRVGLVWRRLG